MQIYAVRLKNVSGVFAFSNRNNFLIRTHTHLNKFTTFIISISTK